MFWKNSDPCAGGGGGSDPLLSAGHFNYTHRPARDTFWGFLFVIFLVVTFAGGFYGISKSNPNFASVFTDPHFQKDPGNCPYPADLGRRLLEEDPPPIDLPSFFRAASLWLLISAAVSFVIGAATLLAFQKYAGFMTRFTINLQIAIPLVAGIAALLSGNFWGGVSLLALAGLVFFVFVAWRNEIDLCGRLLGVAAHALGQNPGLLAFALGFKLVLILLVLPIFIFLFFAYSNGYIVPNEAREGRKSCVDAQGEKVPCCTWQPAGWVPPYMSLASLSLLWTAATLSQLRVFVISGTVAQWYWAVGSYAGGTLRTLRYGLTSSFGSLSLGGAILTLVQVARNALQQAQQQNGNDQNLFLQCLSCILQCIYGLLEYLTKFATVSISMTGESFIEGARHATDLLKRNFLKAYGVWWFPPMVLQTAAVLISLAWAVVIASVFYFFQSADPSLQVEATLLGVLCFVMAWMVQAFVASVLLNVVDATFFCYAVDKDTHAVTNLEIHDIFSQVPVGVAVQQPGGEYAYGTAQPRAPMYGGYQNPTGAQRGFEPDSMSRV